LIPDVEWAGAERNVVMRVSSQCSVCQQHAPFYARLAQELDGTPGVQLTVVTDEEPESIRKWLNERGVQFGRVVHVDRPASLGFLLVPTLLIVDRSGKVTDIMVGDASEIDRNRFVGRLASLPGIQPLDNSNFAEEIRTSEFRRRPLSQGATILDIRDRRRFADGHWPGAINIPADELVVRAAIELRGSGVVALDCRELASTTCRPTARMLKQLRTGGVVALLR